MTKKSAFLALFVCLFASVASAQITAVTAPNSTVNVRAGDDWATLSFQDPMDMRQNTDLSWHVWSIDLPATGMTGVAFNQTSNGSTDMFHAVSTSNNPNDLTSSNPILEILQTNNEVSAKLGRTGDNFPIDTSKYKQLSMRMCLSGSHLLNPPNGAPTNPNSAAFIYWWPEGTFHPDGVSSQPFSQAGALFTVSGCGIYVYDMTTLPIANATATGTPWISSPLVRSLRIDPVFIAGVNIDIDWIRLTAPGTPQPITWNVGAGDIYLDNDTSAANGNLGILANRNGAATNVSSGYSFDPSGLSPGTYFVMVCTARSTPSAANCKHAPGSYVVNGIPTITVTSPSPEGSSDDFATVQLNDAWDFDTTADIDFHQNIASLSIDSAFPAERPDGTSLGNVRVLKGTPAASNPGDGYFYNLWFAGTGRGVTKKIDADRYRILTAEVGLPGPRDINNGSIARVVWKSTSETAENVSQDIIINHRAGVNILDTISVDMKHLLREIDPGLGVSGWTGQIENFRFDPHEFTPITDFYVKRIKLAAFEKIGATMTYTIRWSASDPFNNTAAGAATVSAQYEGVTAAGLPNGIRTNINTCAAIAAATGQCTWNTGSVVAGTYFVYLTVTDGVNTNAAYSAYPVIVDNSSQPKPRIVLERSLVNFGGHNNNGTAVTITPPQQVRLSIVGSGPVNWTATTQGTASHLFTVSPSFGTGPAILTIAVPPNTGLPNNLVGNLGTVVVTSADADNSPQAVTVYLAMTPTTANPFGGFDTPSEGSVLQGSIAVTGWVLDDIAVSKVEVLRDAHPNDPPGAVFGGKVFIANATLVDGARSDIVSLFPNAAANYNAGWGYLMLTRGLIWDGQGPFKLYAQATDIEGHVVSLGSKTVTVDNGSAVKPFGAIDTPGQGETISSVVTNFGWGLTPGSCRIPANGVHVSIDSGPLQPVVYGDVRDDIAAGFPGFTNSPAAGGHYVLDTTQLADGVHTIGWLLIDDCNQADGVGSRFFKIANNALVATTTASAKPALAGSTTAFARLGDDVVKLPTARANTPVTFSLGMTETPVFQRAPASPGRSDVRLREMERVVLNVGSPERGASYAAYRVVDGQLRLLPIGSSFDVQRGAFYWQPAPGFLGDYDFMFVKNVNGIDASSVSVRVTVGPSAAMLRASMFRPVFTSATRPE